LMAAVAARVPCVAVLRTGGHRGRPDGDGVARIAGIGRHSSAVARPDGRPLRLLISFSPKDQELKDQLVRHLAGPGRFAGIDLWTSDQVRPGQERTRAVDEAVNRADVALLLVSADFLASDFLQGVEVPKLVKRCEDGGLRVVPLLLRSCHWEVVPWLQGLVML